MNPTQTPYRNDRSALKSRLQQVMTTPRTPRTDHRQSIYDRRNSSYSISKSISMSIASPTHLETRLSSSSPPRKNSNLY